MNRKLFALLATFTISSVSFATTADPALATPDNVTPAQAVSQPVSSETAKVDINIASVKELIDVKGINTSKAKAIIAYRDKHGKFSSVDDLKKVHGFAKMKSKRLEVIKNQLTAN